MYLAICWKCSIDSTIRNEHCRPPSNRRKTGSVFCRWVPLLECASSWNILGARRLGVYHEMRSCISVNLALEIRLRCELLSFDKYSNSREFKQNESSHHYHIVVRLSFVFFKFQSSLPKETQSTISCMA